MLTRYSRDRELAAEVSRMKEDVTRLKEKVTKMEAARLFEFRVSWLNGGAEEIYTDDVVRAIADHLNLRFERKAAIPASVVAVKEKK